jgi:glycosyltransferase involved in cell wall biosynthesis
VIRTDVGARHASPTRERQALPLQPSSTVFCILSFEGPDVYSQAGGLGTRVKDLARALARLGYTAHLYFVGDPDLPGEQSAVGGRLRLHRWCQWISAHHRGGVYDGEDDKVRDWNTSLPAPLVDDVIVPAVSAGRTVVLMGEEWHTAASMSLIDDALYYRGARDRVVALWNANNVFGFHRINWTALTQAATLTTVSRYMKHRMWSEGVNPIVIPNGIAREWVRDAQPARREAMREAAGADLLLAKIGRFDPDKRWIQAVSAVALLKREGLRARLLMRGGREAHGVEVLATAQQQGLDIENVPSPPDLEGLTLLLATTRSADVVNLTSFVPEEMLGPIYGAADAVLANSGHEPFGLVGLEVMASGGVAVVGSTGEDYAEAYSNALVIETEDPTELATSLRVLRQRPDLATRIRRQGRATARAYTWDQVIPQLLLRVELAAAQQEVDLRPPVG